MKRRNTAFEGGSRKQADCEAERRRLEEVDAEALKQFRRGWCLGSEEFKKRILEETEEQLGEHHFGRLREETAEAKAERIIGEELNRLGWVGPKRIKPPNRKSHPAKLKMAGTAKERNHAVY